MKLNLDLDDLAVESFATEASDVDSSGTVHGHAEPIDVATDGCNQTVIAITCIDCYSFLKTECPQLTTCEDQDTFDLQCYRETLPERCPGYE